MHIAKLFPKQDCSQFDAYGRIISGTLRPGDQARVLCCFLALAGCPVLVVLVVMLVIMLW
jgi:hypothetical protein